MGGVGLGVLVHRVIIAAPVTPDSEGPPLGSVCLCSCGSGSGHSVHLHSGGGTAGEPGTDVGV